MPAFSARMSEKTPDSNLYRGRLQTLWCSGTCQDFWAVHTFFSSPAVTDLQRDDDVTSNDNRHGCPRCGCGGLHSTAHTEVCLSTEYGACTGSWAEPASRHRKGTSKQRSGGQQFWSSLPRPGKVQDTCQSTGWGDSQLPTCPQLGHPAGEQVPLSFLALPTGTR